MYRTWHIFIRKKGKYKKLYKALDEQMKAGKIVYNQALFYLRNLYTGLSKEEGKRTANEVMVIQNVSKYTLEINENRKKKGSGPYPLPGKRKKLIGKNHFTSVMERVFKNDFLLEEELYSKLQQNIIRLAYTDMDTFLKRLEDYSANPEKYTGKQNMPGYKKTDYPMLRFDKQMFSVKVPGQKKRGKKSKKENNAQPLSAQKNKCLTLAWTDYAIKLGKFQTADFTEVQAIMFHDRIELCVCFNGEVEGEKDSVKREKPEAEKILGIDLGVKNFAAVSNNFGMTPFLINGGNICALNRYYNRKKAEEQKKLRENGSGYNSKTLMRLERYRYNCIQDFFHKAARYIVNCALETGAGTIVIGHNNGWKQNPDLGKANTQKFVQIPHSRFINILKDKAKRNGINVVLTEESYTSAASLLDGDKMPVYKEGTDNTGIGFSGRRITRGMYKAGDGTRINADINGAGNIIRKYIPDTMDQNLNYLVETVRKINVA